MCPTLPLVPAWLYAGSACIPYAVLENCLLVVFPLSLADLSFPPLNTGLTWSNSGKRCVNLVCCQGWSSLKVNFAINAPVNCLCALEISHIFGYSLTCNCLNAISCPLKFVLKWLPFQFLIFMPVVVLHFFCLLAFPPSLWSQIISYYYFLAVLQFMIFISQTTMVCFFLNKFFRQKKKAVFKDPF